jgi:hypothetical protein
LHVARIKTIEKKKGIEQKEYEKNGLKKKKKPKMKLLHNECEKK